MYVLFVVVAILVVFAMAAALAGRVGGLPQTAVDRPGPRLPERPLCGDDLLDVQFAVGFRGYRMDQVDAVLDRVADELRQRDEEIAELRSAGGGRG